MSKKGNGLFKALATVGAVYALSKVIDKEEKLRKKKKEQKQEKAKEVISSPTQPIKVIDKVQEKNRNESVIDSFLCPISHEIMMDPVITKYGISYERSSIETWLQNSSICPITKQPLTKQDLICNYALKKAIGEYLSKHS